MYFRGPVGFFGMLFFTGVIVFFGFVLGMLVEGLFFMAESVEMTF